MVAIEFDNERSRMYHLAMGRCPDARKSELVSFGMDGYLDAEPREAVDIGAGDGYLTGYLSGKFPESRIYALDVSDSMTRDLRIKNAIVLKYSSAGKIPLKDEYVDAAFSLAMLHHVSNKKQLFQEVKRILKNGGLLFIADVNDGTPAQEFFDTVVKEYCITGHDFDFLDTEWVSYLAESSGLARMESGVKETPWVFRDDKEMLFFIKNLTGLNIEDDKLAEHIHSIFKVSDRRGTVSLPWQLGYHILKKE